MKLRMLRSGFVLPITDTDHAWCRSHGLTGCTSFDFVKMNANCHMILKIGTIKITLIWTKICSYLCFQDKKYKYKKQQLAGTVQQLFSEKDE